LPSYRYPLQRQSAARSRPKDVKILVPPDEKVKTSSGTWLMHKKTSGRIAELDLLRFLAAISVVVYHFVNPSVFGTAARHVAELGFLGVQLFFLISGFVILWTAMNKSPLAFVVSRISRLYPSFWICVLITASLWSIAGGPVTPQLVLANLTMIPHALGQPMIDSVYWTLLVEIKFYVLVFLLIVAGQLQRIQWWLGAWLALSVAAASASAPHWMQYAALGSYSTYFIAGCYLYLIRTSDRLTLLLIPLGICFLLGVHNAMSVQESFTHDASLRAQFWVASIVVIEYLALLLVAMRRLHLPPSSTWYWLGAMTYPLYLLHNRAGGIVLRWLPSNQSSAALLHTVVIGIALAIALLLAATVEYRICPALSRWLTDFAARLRRLPTQSTANPAAAKLLQENTRLDL
jgi:peptidoglycan/LPS O-acetylase OafA/YrhL